MRRSWVLAWLLVAPVAQAQSESVAVRSGEFHEESLQRRMDELAVKRRDLERQRQEAARAEAGRKPLHATHVFVFGGAETIQIVCQPMRVCDIALQPGERIQSLHIGDSSRWELNPAASGHPAGTVQHVVVKPQFAGIMTNVTVYTDRRVYSFELVSVPSGEYMAMVAFEYRDDVQRRFAVMPEVRGGRESGSRDESAGERGERGDRVEADGPEVGSVERLNFGYELRVEAGSRRRRSDVNFVPRRVYDDGVRTIVELPKSIDGHETPVLLVREGGTMRVVNFRLRGRHFVVDRLFKEAWLVRGTGRKQERVVIRRSSAE